MNFFVFFKYSLILNMMPAKHSKIAGTAETKEKFRKIRKNVLKITRLEHSTGEQVNWIQLSAVIGYKRSITERRSCSQARMVEVHHFVNNCVSK